MPDVELGAGSSSSVGAGAASSAAPSFGAEQEGSGEEEPATSEVRRYVSVSFADGEGGGRVHIKGTHRPVAVVPVRASKRLRTA
jgi:hypothetical protein